MPLMSQSIISNPICTLYFFETLFVWFGYTRQLCTFNLSTPVHVAWSEFGTGLKTAVLLHASSSAVCVRPRQSSGKVKASVKDLNQPTEERFTMTGGT